MFRVLEIHNFDCTFKTNICGLVILALFRIFNCTKVLDRKLMWPKIYSLCPLVNWNDTKIWYAPWVKIMEYHVVECYCTCIMEVLRYFFILQSLTTSKMRKFQTLKLSQFHKVKTCWTENWWSGGNEVKKYMIFFFLN